MRIEKIVSDNIVLREIKTKDLFGYSELFSDSHTMSLFGGSTVDHALDLKNVIDNKKEEVKQNKALFWSITEIEEKEFIGFIRLMNYESSYFDLSYNVMGSLKDDPNFSQYIQRKGWEMEYALLSNYRGKGIIKESIALILKFCLKNDLSPIYAKVNSLSNIPTIKVLLGNGFNEYLPLKNQNGDLGMIYKYNN